MFWDTLFIDFLKEIRRYFPDNQLFPQLVKLHVPLRLLCGLLLLTCNTVMWTMFSKALRHCSSSARATVTTTASNFISSAILGRLIFGETHSGLWWIGISLTLCGLLVLHSATPHTKAEKKDK
ncbi:transmembrane protein 42-like isoform X3 [Girardinichthys multiradiatus]|uniref:transmembrane protein 42-like isoform X3 n=1 Tax=Girardinichthys multiradiatus TaxID=208333 RepID=UPI001FAC3D12|nr:transmembrane protein 42-like isoform X3 [Girardinichthys multiradiatus]